MAAYYNENAPHAVAALQQLMHDGVIAPGVIDDRSIEEVQPDDLRGFTQAHFFAGAGAWSVAARLAGWEDDRPLWTGSAPCFPAATLVMTDTGFREIQEVGVGERVLTHNHRFRRVTHVGHKWAPTVCLRGQGHFGLLTTPGHPFYARETKKDYRRKAESYGKTIFAGSARWVPAGDLAGKMWATVASVPITTMPELPVDKGFFWDKNAKAFIVKGEKAGRNVYVGVFASAGEAAGARRQAVLSRCIDVRGADAVDVTSDEFARFLGYWIGDGWVSGDTVYLCGAKQDAPLLDFLFESIGLQNKAYIERTSSRIRIGSKALSTWLTYNFGAGALGKTLPTWLFGMSDSYRESFLDGWFTADGHFQKQSRGGSDVRCWTTASKKLAIALRILLNLSERSASIAFKKPNRVCSIEGREVNERGFYRITEHQYPRSFKFTDGHGWGRVRSVEQSKIAIPVFNLAVEEDESYTADGIVVHNCQPFSVAGKGRGADDPRHLWPHLFRLVRAVRPPVLVGEQVAGKPGYGWFDGVSADLEFEDYSCRAVDIPACGINSPQRRNRLYWVSVGRAPSFGRREGRAEPEFRSGRPTASGADVSSHVGGTTSRSGSSAREPEAHLRQAWGGEHRGSDGGYWRDAEWIACHDGKARRVPKSAFRNVADGVSGTNDPIDLAGGYSLLVPSFKGRVQAWKLAGNAIVIPLAAQVLSALLETQFIEEKMNEI
jgi:hypothetical protein